MNIFTNETQKVKEQYSKADGLSTRLSMHEKYSTNRMGLGNWYFTFYNIKEGAKILELGCGTGAMWQGHKDVLSKCSEVVLSDFSAGMLETTKKNLGEMDNVEYRVIDIQDIPYEDNYFDVVIANSMLYHVPDVDKAISEVNRVLKSDGIFYAGTTSCHGIMETITDWLGIEASFVNVFCLENGGEQLEKHFAKVDIERYIDSLEVTDIDDLMEYIYSGITFKNVCTLPRDKVKDILESHRESGVIRLPKGPGVFVASK